MHTVLDVQQLHRVIVGLQPLKQASVVLRKLSSLFIKQTIPINEKVNAEEKRVAGESESEGERERARGGGAGRG